jgi:hypothetical protein
MFRRWSPPAPSAWFDREVLDQTGSDDDPDLTIWDSIIERLFPLAETILQRKATTLAGLAVQVHAIALTDAEWFYAAEDQLEKWRARLLLETLCHFLDIKPAPLRARLRCPANALEEIARWRHGKPDVARTTARGGSAAPP